MVKTSKRRNCKILINGESIGQVASQTLNSMNVINEVVKIPVIRPVACFDKLEIIDIAKKINTYETSILPFEDCCTIFLPKHPVINPKLDVAIKEENKFDYEKLIEEVKILSETQYRVERAKLYFVPMLNEKGGYDVKLAWLFEVDLQNGNSDKEYVIIDAENGEEITL